MMKHALKKIGMLEKSFYIKKVGVGKLIINFIFQRIFRINSQVPVSVNFTSIFIGSSLYFNEKDYSVLTSFASSNSLYIQSLNGVYFGRNVLIAPGVKIISANHSFDRDRKSVKSSPVRIGNDVWIGANSIILPAVQIADGVVIGAGSVVTKSFHESGVVIAGNPAKLIKKL